MNAHTHRNENSVQMSLTQLRQLHSTRIETARELEEKRSLAVEAQRLEAEKQRLAEERAAEEKRIQIAYQHEQQRLAAEHELELAKEQARVEAEARVREKQLELQLRQADSEMLKTQAMMPKQRTWVGLTVVALLLMALQGGLFWQQTRSDARVEAVHETARENQRDAYDAAKTVQELKRELGAATQALTDANTRADDLEARLAELEKNDSGKSSSTRNPKRDPNKPTIRKPRPQEPTEVVVPCTDRPIC